MKRKLVPFCALLCCACGADLATPVSAVAVSYDVQSQAFKLAQVRINTLTSLRHLQGSSGDVTAGGAVQTSAQAALEKGATVRALRAAFIVVQPAQVNLSWNVLNDIVYPEDYASLELLSTYYNLEKARTLLAQWVPAGVALQAEPVVAHATVADARGIPTLPDGELYYEPLAMFFAPATTPQQQVPPAFNLGAVAHALGHEALQQIVWGGAPVPAPELGPAGDAGWNTSRHVVRSLSEGIGDYLGVAVSGDPRWFDHSLQRDADARALDQVRCGNSSMLAALPANDDTPYDPFPLGSVLAGALWESSRAGVQVSAAGVLAALPVFAAAAAAAQGKLTLPAILDALVSSADPTRKASLCGLFLNRFTALKIQPSQLPSCSAVTPAPHTECQ